MRAGGRCSAQVVTAGRTTTLVLTVGAASAAMPLEWARIVAADLRSLGRLAAARVLHGDPAAPGRHLVPVGEAVFTVALDDADWIALEIEKALSACGVAA